MKRGPKGLSVANALRIATGKVDGESKEHSLSKTGEAMRVSKMCRG